MSVNASITSSIEENLENGNKHINTASKAYCLSTQSLYIGSRIMMFYMIGSALPSHVDMTWNQRQIMCEIICINLLTLNEITSFEFLSRE